MAKTKRRQNKRKRKNRIRRLPISRQPHRFVRYAEPATIDLTGTTPVYGAYTFSLSQLVNSSELISLYDEYTIDGVEVIFNLNVRGFSGQGTQVGAPRATSSPLMWSLVDFNDDTPPAASDTLRQCSKVQMHRLKDSYQTKIFLRPAVLTQLYESTTSTGYGSKWGQKISTADSSVPHYALKWLIQKDPSIDFGFVQVDFKYYITMRNTK